MYILLESTFTAVKIVLFVYHLGSSVLRWPNEREYRTVVIPIHTVTVKKAELMRKQIIWD